MNTKEVLRVVRDAVSSHTGCEKELYEGLNPFLIRADVGVQGPAACGRSHGTKC